MSDAPLALKVFERIEALGRISDQGGGLTRLFCSPAMRRANDLVASWMREAGMEVREDHVGNLIGRYGEGGGARAEGANAKVLLLGSHLDTVRNAGKFDGPLGVLVAIACVAKLKAEGRGLPFAIEVIGFADEEGVRYQSTYLGSRVMAGTFQPEELVRTDAFGLSMGDAIRGFGGDPERLKASRLDPERTLGYVEVHIEQGPVLEERGLAVGLVTAIAGQTRCEVNFAGRAGHAGTTPMSLRRDALCAGAEFVLAVEAAAQTTQGLVATVGEISALPGASNVIPGEARLTLDVRHAQDALRQRACGNLEGRASEIAARRNMRLDWQKVHEAAAVTCDPHLSHLLGEAVKRHQPELVSLPSGAGHDGAALAAVIPVSMLFVRCKGGVSHHPDESASVEDVETALVVINEFLQLLAHEHA